MGMNGIQCAAAAALLLLAGCGVTTSYIGKSYPATSDPDVYLDWADIPCAYETIGRIAATSFWTAERAQAKIEAIAREKGADAIVFTDAPAPKKAESEQSAPAEGQTRTILATEKDVTDAPLRATFIRYKK